MENIKGLILKSINYKESSKIIYIYTDAGLRSCLIHGSNKMKNRYLNLSRVLNYIDIHVSGKDLLTFRDGDVLNGFRDLAGDLEKYTYCTHILELIYSFSSHQHDHEKLLNFLLKIFTIIEKEENYIPYLNMIELKLLYLLGVNPLLTQCVECERVDNLFFSITEGGMCCSDHIKNPMNITEKALFYFKFLYYFDLSKDSMLEIDEITLKELRNILDRYYEYHLNIKTKSRELLMGLLGY
ncbi:MAG: DNA repair protein RecO [Tenericutes bacterium]|nr:DNA repair protein RecO [Mycoplasmatota bacterium]